jgi:hypothetical protein
MWRRGTPGYGGKMHFWLTATVGIGYAVAILLWILLSPPAKASPGIGCETLHWGFLGSQFRTICDGPRQADGSWMRARRVWVDERWIPGYCGTYYCSAGYWRSEGTVAFETYPVTDATVLPDEPGWLPTGSVVLR